MRDIPSSLVPPRRGARLARASALLVGALAAVACHGVARGPAPPDATGVANASADCPGVRVLVVRNPTVHDLRISAAVDDRTGAAAGAPSEELGIARAGRSEFALTVPATRFYAVRVAGGGAQPSNQDHGRGTSPDAGTVQFSVVCRPDAA